MINSASLSFLIEVVAGLSSLGLFAISTYKLLKQEGYRPSLVTVILFASGSLLAGFTLALVLSPLMEVKPTVEIISPQDQVSCLVCSGQDTPCITPVEGTSEQVLSDPDLRIFVLVNPYYPHKAKEWWVQLPGTRPVEGGRWSVPIRLAGKDGRSPPENGAQFRLVAVVVDKEARLDEQLYVPGINFPGVLARSEIVIITTMVSLNS